MQRHSLISFLLCLALALTITGCSSGDFQTSGGNIPNYQYPTINNGSSTITLDGNTPSINFTNQTTPWLNIGGASEVSIWENCTGSTNISRLIYQYSMDQVLIQNGSTSLPTCSLNLSKTDITDKGMGYIRFFIGTNSTSSSATTNGTIILVSTR